MQKRPAWIAAAAVLVVLQWLLAAPAFAQASRTWVSGVGDDANPCSRTAPCKTFAGAISKTAAGGEISVLDPGGYGALTITKSITLNGEGTLASILVSGTNAINVSTNTTDVVIIRNLSLDGIGTGINGINFLAGGKLVVENVTIFGFTGNGISFTPTVASNLAVSRTNIHDCLRGILVQPGPSGTAMANLTGVVLTGNTLGLRVFDAGSVTVRDSSIDGNSGNGVAVAGATRVADASIENTDVSGNAAAGIFSGTLGIVRISNVMVTRNATGLSASGGAIVSFGNNRVLGNTSVDGAPTSTSGQI